MLVTHYQYEPVRYKTNGTYTVDGITKRRTRTFEQTINPFNTNEQGAIKTRNEIMVELKREAAAWREELKRGSN